MNGQTPTMESRPLSETVGTSDLDKMLHEYVKPAFLRLPADKRQAAIDMLNKMADEA